MIQRLIRRRPGWKRVCAAWLGCMFLFNALCSAVHPVKDILDYKALGLSYQERLVRGMDPSAIPYWRQVNGDIARQGYRGIGFDSHVGNGDYFWMRAFAPEAYEVYYLNASTRPDLEAEDFVPDCIIGSYSKDGAPEAMEYHGARYVRRFPATCIFWPQEYGLFVTAYYVREGLPAPARR